MQNFASDSLSLGLDIRQHFPIFSTGELHYLDSAASTQKPRAVIDRISRYLSFEHANIHRGAYRLSAEATENYDQSKRKVAGFLGAPDERSIIFTKGTTEAVNLAAQSFQDNLSEGDVILLTLLEHHSNIVPWQLLAARKKLKIVFADITDNAELDHEDFYRKLEQYKPKLAAFTAVANSFGSCTDLRQVISESKRAGARTFVDAAQAVQHLKLNVAELQPDFLAFSGHKLYGPTGIGALYVNPEIWNLLIPYQGGGDMISNVTVDGSEWAEFPQKFEAGTPPIAEAIALGTAIDFISAVGLEKIRDFEHKLFCRAWELLSSVKGVRLYGPAVKCGPENAPQCSIISFNLEGVHAHDLSTVADSFGVQIRAGHHCAIPALKRLDIPSSARASIGVYSDISDFEALAKAIEKARSLFAG